MPWTCSEAARHPPPHRGSRTHFPHSSGTLYHILSHFIFNNVNMTHIESRPIPGRTWEYRFFIDFEGNLNEASVKNALRGIREEAINMKILGNY